MKLLHSSLHLVSCCPLLPSRRAEERRRHRTQEVEADNTDRSLEEAEPAAKRLRTSSEAGIVVRHTPLPD